MLHENKTADNYIRWIIFAGEILAINLALVTMFLIYIRTEHLTPPHYKRLMLLLTLTYAVCEMRGTSRVHRRFVRGDQLLRNLMACLTTFIFASWLVLWVFRWPLLTWGFMLPFYAFVIVFVSLYRWWMRQLIKYLRQKGRNSMTVMFVGNINVCAGMYKQMKSDPSCGYRVLGYFSDEQKTDVTQEGYLGRVEDSISYLQKHAGQIHNLYCVLPTDKNPFIRRIIHECDKLVIRYNHIPDSFNYQHHTMEFSMMANTPVFTIHHEPLANGWNRAIKRTFDFTLSTIFLVLIFPWVYLIFGYLIKRSSPGPIFFKQKRSGLEGKDFYCYKFRSMKVNVDSDTQQATKDDPRKTKIGEFMRKTSIDELPQFINVWMGQMSIVGPRPHMVSQTGEYGKLIGNYMVRHFAKPGITGMAQVSGFRGETKELWQMEGRIKKDVWYIEHWNVMLDIFIIWKTIANAVHGDKDAY